jgi:glucose-6-phosphate dehydrogenase assembly protein OpcA
MSTPAASIIALQAPTEVTLDEVNTELLRLWSNPDAIGNGDNTPAASRAATFSLIVYEPQETQSLLAELGFYSGPVDGIDGPRTKAAIQAAQKQFGLIEDGRTTPELLNTLREKVANQTSVPESTMAFSTYGGIGIADEVAQQNPCRIIALFPISQSLGQVSAEVSAYCPIQKQSSNLVCCEYITLKGTQAELSGISGFIQSLSIGDLPKFLWWKALPDINQELFRKLAPSCNLVIVDSSTFADAATALKDIHHLHQQGIKIVDLNWRRLAAWQELTAEAFDPPSRRAALKEVDRITLDYEAGNPAQALMFLGWIASRLQWQPVKFIREAGVYDLLRIEFTNHEQRRVEAELAAIPVGNPGDIVGDLIDLKLASTNLDADCCTVICSETRGCMRMEAGGGAQSCRVQQVSPLADQSSETLLGQQLQRWGRDQLFEESLTVTARLLQLQQELVGVQG